MGIQKNILCAIAPLGSGSTIIELHFRHLCVMAVGKFVIDRQMINYNSVKYYRGQYKWLYEAKKQIVFFRGNIYPKIKKINWPSTLFIGFRF